MQRRGGASLVYAPMLWKDRGLGSIAALLLWYLWPNTPNQINGDDGSAQAVCNNIPTDSNAACLHRAAPALDAHNLAWWLALPMHMGIMGLVWAVVVASFVSGCLLLGRFWMLARRS